MRQLQQHDLDPFDFSRVDRIPASQLAVVHFLQESFVRSVASSLAAYLRSYVSGTLVSVEQLRYSEFADGLVPPTCMAYVSMRPYEGYAAVEIGPALVTPILDLVLGGNGETFQAPNREVTELEQSILDGLFRLMLRDLTATWRQMVNVEFDMVAMETKPLASPRIAPTETVVSCAMELRIGETVSGIVNLAISSLTLKIMSQKFDHRRTTRKVEPAEAEQATREKLARKLSVNVGGRLNGISMRLRDLWNLEPGKVIDLRKCVGTPMDVTINGKPMLKGAVVEVAGKQAVQLTAVPWAGE